MSHPGAIKTEAAPLFPLPASQQIRGSKYLGGSKRPSLAHVSEHFLKHYMKRLQYDCIIDKIFVLTMDGSEIECYIGLLRNSYIGTTVQCCTK